MKEESAVGKIDCLDDEKSQRRMEMAAKKEKKSNKKVKSLPAKTISIKHAKAVTGGIQITRQSGKK